MWHWLAPLRPNKVPFQNIRNETPSDIIRLHLHNLCRWTLERRWPSKRPNIIKWSKAINNQRNLILCPVFRLRHANEVLGTCQMQNSRAHIGSMHLVFELNSIRNFKKFACVEKEKWMNHYTTGTNSLLKEAVLERQFDWQPSLTPKLIVVSSNVSV